MEIFAVNEQLITVTVGVQVFRNILFIFTHDKADEPHCLLLLAYRRHCRRGHRCHGNRFATNR